MVRHAYRGAHFVPMAVPNIWLNILESNKKLLFSKISSSDSRINSLVKFCGIRFYFLIIKYSTIPSRLKYKSTGSSTPQNQLE